MKIYLLVVMALGLVGANAENNPFDLQKNLQKIDQDQEVLLSALQEMADKKDDFLDDDVTPQIKDNMPLREEVSSQLDRNVELPKLERIGEKSVEKELKQEEPSNEELMGRLREETTKQEMQNGTVEIEADAEEERIKKVKEAQAKIEEERAKAEVRRLEVERAEKIAAEKREVEAYEAERRAKKIEAEKLEEKKRKEKLAKEESQRLVREVAQKEEELKAEAAKELEEKKHAIVDINVTKEEMMAKSEADKAYLDAVREMD